MSHEDLTAMEDLICEHGHLPWQEGRALIAEVERLRYFMRQRYDTIDGEPVCLLDYYDRLNPENIDWRRSGPHSVYDPEPPVYRPLYRREMP